jgi:hypothetical protein
VPTAWLTPRSPLMMRSLLRPPPALIYSRGSRASWHPCSGSHLTRLWRKVDSNPQSPCCERPCWALLIGTSKFQVRHRDDSLAEFPTALRSRWDHEFESACRGVRNEPCGYQAACCVRLFTLNPMRFRCVRARSSIATPVDGNWLPVRQQHSLEPAAGTPHSPWL